MTYEKAIAYIESKRHLGSNLGLTRVEKLCALLGNPEKKSRFIHVAGTNGKGSVCALCAAVLRAALYKTGLYLSPYLEDFRESMQINGEWISKEELAYLTAKIIPAVETLEQDGFFPTEYEIATVLAFLFYAENGCDIVVLETGLGGQLDATNVIKTPLVSVITSISLDHTKILGDTIGKIAQVKSGIIKKDGDTVCYPRLNEEALSVIADRAKEQGNSLILPDLDQLRLQSEDIHGSTFTYKGLSVFVALSGEHQVYNALTAIETLRLLNKKGYIVSDDAIATGFASVRHPARQEILCESPLVLLDGAHNAEGAAFLARSIAHTVKKKPLVVMMGILADKDFESAIASLAVLCDSFIAVRPPNPRALPPKETALTALKYCADVEWFEEINEAVQCAFKKSGKSGAIVICGSLYQASVMRAAVQKHVDCF